MHFLDLSHTSHTRARSGIQRVSRALFTELTHNHNALPITWDPYADAWRELAPWEITNLKTETPSVTRGARWPWSKKMNSRFMHWRGSIPSLPPSARLIVPELFSPSVARALPKLDASKKRVAIFHDAIALKLPELSPPATVARFPSYMQELLQFDGIAAVSEESKQTLQNYWKWLGVLQPPAVETIPLGIDQFERLNESPSDHAQPLILCVGTIEGRKNHLTLLDAAEALWAKGHKFSLRMIGMANRQTGALALQKIAFLQNNGCPLIYDGAVDEATLHMAYSACAFTVYPSIMEGFGLPVLESLARGKPCICSSQGALGESARPGGALILDDVSASTLADGMAQLLQNPVQIEQLSQDASQRSYRTWTQYTNELLDWMESLP